MQRKPFLFAVSGVKNSGKTTLITKLIPILSGYGLKVATIRHATIRHDGHEFCPDVPGTDTCAHLQAGACGSAVFSATRCMVVKQQEQVSEQQVVLEQQMMSEQQLVQLFPEADLILLEGFKYSSYPKVEIVRRGSSRRCVCSGESLMAVVSDLTPEEIEWAAGDRGTECGGCGECDREMVDGCGECDREMVDGCAAGGRGVVPLLDLNDAEKIAALILDLWFARTKLSMIVLAGGRSSRMGSDKADLPYESRTFLWHQIEKGRKLGIEDILVSGYRGTQELGSGMPDCGISEYGGSGRRNSGSGNPGSRILENDVRVIADRYKECGPLGGLEASLRSAVHDYCLVLAVDVPLVSVEELGRMIHEFREVSRGGMARGQKENGGNLTQGQKENGGNLTYGQRECPEDGNQKTGRPCSCMILKHGDRREPLIGIYRSDLADDVEQELLAGKGSVFALLEKLSYQTYESMGAEQSFQNINNREEYERINPKGGAC
ncbi:MAG: molybdopterin-guanine dinucleotide biosynthesis protein B [Eubacteriales bacterium]|nr:molybdopterin-guanine dinucleotide biosynthesis protein B [Eubacteriales bacterium]